MQQLKYFGIIIILSICFQSQAQKGFSYDEVNTKSYNLYEKGDWTEVLNFGKEAIAEGQDFLSLRLRMGFAAFKLNNFSEAIKHYNQVLKSDSYNSIAHYYLWLCRKYLNQVELSTYQAKFLSKDVLEQEKLKSLAFTQVGFEVSYKQTDITSRDNTTYARIDIGNRFGWNLNMLQSVASYQQNLKEPLLNTVINPNNIQINQTEYYNRLTLNLNDKWQLKCAYHFVYTPFNNLIYNNHLGLVGVKYNDNYFDVQADIVFGTVTDASFKQYNLQLGLYPLGNLNFYSFSSVFIRDNNQTGTNFKQVIGGKLFKNTWIEANATLGYFNNLVENDALYLYNAIDANKFKGGASLFYTISKNCVAQINYTFEEREFYKKTTLFNQHSITGGVTWKF